MRTKKKNKDEGKEKKNNGHGKTLRKQMTIFETKKKKARELGHCTNKRRQRWNGGNEKVSEWSWNVDQIIRSQTKWFTSTRKQYCFSLLKPHFRFFIYQLPLDLRGWGGRKWRLNCVRDGRRIGQISAGVGYRIRRCNAYHQQSLTCRQ